MAWDPNLYSAFAKPRLRPALDLVARIETLSAGLVADLGCGTGSISALLADRWPDARIFGIDTSPDMLAKADRASPVTWVQADITAWTPPGPADVLFSNAALHWVDDHAGLFPRLMGMLAPGGWLAVQMPRNYHAPSHTAIIDAARSGPWRDLLEPLLRPEPVAPPAFYYDLLAPIAAALDIWETEYLHVLDGEDAVMRWTGSTALRPLSEALADHPAWKDDFLEEYRRRLAAAYPRLPDGRTLFPFRRLFLIARRGLRPD